MPRKDRKRGRKRKADGVTSLVSGWSYALPSQSQAATPRDAARGSRALSNEARHPPSPHRPHRAINFDVRTVERCTYTRPAAEYVSPTFFPYLLPPPTPPPRHSLRVLPPPPPPQPLPSRPPPTPPPRFPKTELRNFGYAIHYATVNRLTVEKISFLGHQSRLNRASR